MYGTSTYYDVTKSTNCVCCITILVFIRVHVWNIYLLWCYKKHKLCMLYNNTCGYQGTCMEHIFPCMLQQEKHSNDIGVHVRKIYLLWCYNVHKPLYNNTCVYPDTCHPTEILEYCPTIPGSIRIHARNTFLLRGYNTLTPKEICCFEENLWNIFENVAS